ncbi:SRPBCC family protein [Agrococcus beijingensis]|uniref:SRPBCC family protein n=1 Tax=Agrococcus beijingensis TaxID=3068634 RepID=UPI002740C037|nr:SRPBCC domain-containing protein [Agrococcus sp. REN33]
MQQIRIEQAVDIAAHADVVWHALVDEPSAWWGKPYLLLEGMLPGMPCVIELPLRAGEAVLEHAGDASALWGVVTECVPGASYAWRGQMGMGDNVEGHVRLVLEPRPRGTRVSLVHEAALLWGDGGGADGVQRSYDEGWADLLARLKALVETGARHGSAGLSAPVAPAARGQ